MENFWDQRFSQKEYAYGLEASKLLQQVLPAYAPGKILFPGEGEGRNAVFAAQLSWNVYAFDQSSEGRKKAIQLAKKCNVNIQYDMESYEDFEAVENQFDAVALIYTHMPSEQRVRFHKKMIGALKKGGLILLEGFTKSQLGKLSGGPQNLDMLYSKEELKKEFQTLSKLEIIESNSELKEGLYHQGEASIIHLIGIK